MEDDPEKWISSSEEFGDEIGMAFEVIDVKTLKLEDFCFRSFFFLLI
jgi:hypothetical protein